MESKMSKITEVMEWNKINWKSVEDYILRMQIKIYHASKSNNVNRIRSLQNTLIRSYRARLLAVRKVSQDNSGKKTAGVDGVKSLTPKQRMQLAKSLRLTSKSNPLRRVQIPKSNGKIRNLGIPTMRDRATQALVKMALEPEWEAKFYPNSYGFRPGRSCHDAIKQIFNCTTQNREKVVWDADLAGCFDNINHEGLMKNLNNSSKKVKGQIMAWLKSGVTIGYGGKSEPTESGTPQGGVISPLLANIALNAIDWKFHKAYGKVADLIRYADDFVIIMKKGKEHKLTDIQNSVRCDLKHLAGLDINQEKSSVLTTVIGFEFLGFNIRQYPVGKYRSFKNNKSIPLGFVTLIKPSKKAISKHYRKCAEIIDKHEIMSKEALIDNLNPVIRGWCNYYKHVSSKKTFKDLDNKIFHKLLRMLKSKFAKTGMKKIVDKCFERIGNRKWAYGKLLQHCKIAIVRHVQVKTNQSPFDGNMKYWGQRMKKGYAGLTKRQQYLLTQQKGKCTFCNKEFKIGDVLEVDHIKPKSMGGTNDWGNLQLLHRHCHDSKTAHDLKMRRAKQG